MPVSGLPPAVEAVLQTLLSQYHLVSWQVTGGEHGVVLTLRWSLTPNETPSSPPQAPRVRRRHTHHGRDRSRRTSQWLEQTPDSTLSSTYTVRDPQPEDVEFLDIPHPTRTPQCTHHHEQVRERIPLQDQDYQDGAEDSDPPPLPPPPPLPDHPQTHVPAEYGGHNAISTDTDSHSDTGSHTTTATTDTVIEVKPRPRLKTLVIKHRKEIRKMREEQKKEERHTQGIKPVTSKGKEQVLSEQEIRVSRTENVKAVKEKSTSTRKGSPTKHVPRGSGEGHARADVDPGYVSGVGMVTEDHPKPRYHFRELIRKHTLGIKEMARKRKRDKVQKKKFAPKKLDDSQRSQSEDNLLEKEKGRSSKERSNADDSAKSQSEASLTPKNSVRRVRFGEVDVFQEGDSHAPQAASPPTGETAATGQPQEGEESVEGVESDNGDSSDADEIGSRNAPRKIGAIFRVGTYVAKQRRGKLLK